MAYPAIIRAKAKILVEKGHSERETAEKLKIAEATVKLWKAKYKWKKHALTEKMAERTEESILQICDKVGATKEFVIRKAFELANAEVLFVPAANGFSQIPVDPEKNVNADGKYEFMGISEEIEAGPDRKSQMKGLELLSDFMKLRDKDITITMPAPLIIKTPEGQTLEKLGFQLGSNPSSESA